jgi:inner membrane protein YidH
MENGKEKAGDHLANERTFLAWTRTSISIIVFGFVVAKFGITLREFLHMQGRALHESSLSLGIGVGFMAMGVFLAVMAVVRYRLTMVGLAKGEFRPASKVIVFLGVVTAVFGAILAIYLVATAGSSMFGAGG